MPDVAKYAPLGKISEEFFDSIFHDHVKGILFTVQKALHSWPMASIILNASLSPAKGLWRIACTAQPNCHPLFART